MKVFSVSQVKSIINAFEEKGLGYVDTMGSKSGVYLDGAIKYAAYDPNIKLIAVSDINEVEKTICVALDDCILDYSDVKSAFGEPLKTSYSFRDLFTQFHVYLPSNNKVSKIYFIKDGRFEAIGESKFIEIANIGGKKTEISRLVFDRFFLKITL